MIKIEQLLPFMKEGWVAMSRDGVWDWFDHKPKAYKRCGYWCIVNTKTRVCPFDCFDIAPADDWEKSLIKVEGKND